MNGDIWRQETFSSGSGSPADKKQNIKECYFGKINFLRPKVDGPQNNEKGKEGNNPSNKAATLPS